MNFFEKLIRKNKIVLIVFLAVFIAGAVMTAFLFVNKKVNTDVLTYLPSGYSSDKGIKFLEENFGIKGDAFVVVNGQASDTGLNSAVKKVEKLEGVKQLVWYNTVEMVELIGKFTGIKVNTEDVKNYLRQPVTDVDGNITSYNYVLLLLIDYKPSDLRAYKLHSEIKKELGQSGREVCISGMVAMADNIVGLFVKELPYFCLIAGFFILLFLFIFTTSWFSPIIILICVALAVIMNTGACFLLNSVNLVGLGMGIFLQIIVCTEFLTRYLKIYQNYRDGLGKDNSVELLVKSHRTFIITAIVLALASIPLYFCKWQALRDIATVFIIGLACNLLTVLFFAPCLIHICDKPIQKSRHKYLPHKSTKIFNGALKASPIVASVALLLLIPAIYGITASRVSYTKILPKDETSQEILADKLQNQVIVAVPLESKIGEPDCYINELEMYPDITTVLGAYSILEGDPKQITDILNNLPSEIEIPALKLFFNKINDRYYTLYLVGISGDLEGERGEKTYRYLTDVTGKHFDAYYTFGLMTGGEDFSTVAHYDFLIIYLIGIIIILVTSILLLKSISKGVIISILTCVAVGLNYGIFAIFQEVNFVPYLMSGLIQATVFLCWAFRLSDDFGKTYDKDKLSDKVAYALNVNFYGISLVGGTIGLCALAVSLITANPIIADMAGMLALGTAINYMLALFVFPCMLVVIANINNKSKIFTKKRK